MLAGSPALLSLPETHILRLGIGRGGLQMLSIFQRKALLESLRDKLRALTAETDAPKFFLSRSELVLSMVSLMDKAAVAGSYTGWVEKTPEHIFYVSQIETHFSDAQFVHVVRDGRAVVASIVEMWDVYTRDWGRCRLSVKELNDYLQAVTALRNSSLDLRTKVGPRELWAMKSLARACLLWNHCMSTTKNCYGKSNHLIIDYDDLTSNPARQLEGVCNFLEVDFDATMMQSEKSALSLVTPEEKWKQDNFDSVRQASTRKYDSLPTLERRLVCELLAASGDPNLFLSGDCQEIT